MSADRAAFRKKLTTQTIIAPGVYDGLSARIADAVGFDASLNPTFGARLCCRIRVVTKLSYIGLVRID